MMAAEAKAALDAADQKALEAQEALSQSREAEAAAQRAFDERGEKQLEPYLKAQAIRGRNERLLTNATDEATKARAALDRAELAEARQRFVRVRDDVLKFPERIAALAFDLIDLDRKVTERIDSFAAEFLEYSQNIAECERLLSRIGKVEYVQTATMQDVRVAVAVALRLAREKEERPHEDWLRELARPTGVGDDGPWQLGMSFLNEVP